MLLLRSELYVKVTDTLTKHGKTEKQLINGTSSLDLKLWLRDVSHYHYK